MNTKKLYIALCSVFLATQMVSAQQKMFVVDNDGKINAINVSSVDYVTFDINTTDKLFSISDDGIEGATSNSITSACTVGLSAESNVKTLSITPEVGVCYSKKNAVPTIDDNCLSLGSELKSYTFTLKSLISGTTYYFRTYVKLANGVFYGDVARAKTLDTAPVDNSKTINGHKFIDLGLPSGLLWAETNVGAAISADDGEYFAWGETEAKSYYDWNTYKYGTDYDNLTKYNSSDGKTTLEPEDDAAYVNWGDSCRMPTGAEFGELLSSDNCTWTWTSKANSSGSSIDGYKVTSVKNGNSIFLPASGFRNNGDLYRHGSRGYYWSSSRNAGDASRAYYLNFLSGYRGTYFDGCYNGHTVRPVAEP